MSRAVSLLLRSVLAIGLMVGFYVLALGVAGMLLYIPYAELVYLNRLDVRIGIFCVFAAFAILWSVVPRPDKFEAPGPELEPAQHPELFRLIDSVRQATDQSPPASVYLIPEVNAWVTQRGGWMGFGSRRVMGIGLPLLEALTVDQFRAVLSHEFGHYHAGDTMLGPWIQKTRMGILRTLGRLGDSWIRLPFVGYANLFFRITNAVSRAQEFAADALAAHVAGSQALIGGLKQLHRADAAFSSFWQTEYVPALNHNVRPPLGTGFARFMEHQKVSSDTDRLLATALSEGKTNPFDSHPPLADRCAALERIPDSTSSTDARPASSLLNSIEDLERELLAIAVQPDLRSARPVTWNEIPRLVWYTAWKQQVGQQANALQGYTAADAARLFRDPDPVAAKLVFPSGYLPDMDQRRIHARRFLAMAVAVALADHGWEVQGDLADPISCTRGGESIEPFTILDRYQSADTPLEEWQDQCIRLGIASLPLETKPLPATA